MSKEQKWSLAAACVLYVITIIGFFYFSLTLIVVVFLLFSLCISYFAYLCYKTHKDYTGAEHFQQEIGLLKAEKEQIVGDYEILISEKDTEIGNLRGQSEELSKKLTDMEAEKDMTAKKLEEVSIEVKKAERMKYESLMPPEDDEQSEVDIVEIAKRAVAELDKEAKEVGLRVTISSSFGKLMVKASGNRLLVMFRNIIDNSIKYMQTAGNLVITISTVGDDIFIVLKDTGKGLPEDETKHIFELNYQGSNRISGNGLGLTQAKAIVEHYGGTIYARSPQGNGMGIYIQLPTV